MSETYTVQAGDDSWMHSGAPTTNYYTGTTVTIGADGSSYFVAIFKFDLTPIMGTEIVSATFSTFMNLESAGTNRTGYLYRLLVDWTPSQVTWNKRNSSSNWSSGGARGSGTDSNRTAFASRTLNQSVSPGTQWDWTLDTTVFQGWADGDYSNYGWVLDPGHINNDYWALRSFNYATESQRPKLVVTYDVIGSQLQTVVIC